MRFSGVLTINLPTAVQTPVHRFIDILPYSVMREIRGKAAMLFRRPPLNEISGINKIFGEVDGQEVLSGSVTRRLRPGESTPKENYSAHGHASKNSGHGPAATSHSAARTSRFLRRWGGKKWAETSLLSLLILLFAVKGFGLRIVGQANRRVESNDQV